MSKLRSLLVLSVVTAVLCGAWSVLANQVGLIGWAGFAGCTTYFASGSHGAQGVKRTVFPNLAGVVCGMLTILLGAQFPALDQFGVWCALLTFVMCIFSYLELFDFCPGIFMGCFTTFAAGGDWKLLVPSLLLGAVLGLGCDSLTNLILKVGQKS